MKVDTRTLIDLLRSSLAADYTTVRRIGNLLARSLAENNDLESAKEIQAVLRRKGVPLRASGYAEALPRDAGSSLPLIEEGQWPTTIELEGSFACQYRNSCCWKAMGVGESGLLSTVLIRRPEGQLTPSRETLR